MPLTKIQEVHRAQMKHAKHLEFETAAAKYEGHGERTIEQNTFGVDQHVVRAHFCGNDVLLRWPISYENQKDQ